MANYSTLQAAINAGTTNMTVLRNNSKNDDGTTTYATGIDWFKFNNVTVNNIYSSGNSWIGLGVSSEQLRVNRRDTAVYYEYKETGVIGETRFFKFRWVGYSAYYSTDSTYYQAYDVYLLETGQIFLYFYKVPSSYNDGSKQLICGSQTAGFSATSGTVCEVTYTPSDASAGTGFTVSYTRPDIDIEYKPSGLAILSLTYASGGNDALNWTAETPTGTSLAMSVKVNNGAWQSISNGGAIQGMTAGQTYSLQVKAELATTDVTTTPRVTQISIVSDEDRKIIVLGINTPNFSPAVGDVAVVYDGNGGLAGYGGPASGFSEDFTPTGAWKGNQSDQEHIEFDMVGRIVVTPVSYRSYKLADEHIEVSSIGASIVLTDAHDL